MFYTDEEIVTVSARDQDVGTAGQITYEIGTSQDNFYIEPTTGVIKVKPNSILDLEKSPFSYRLTVGDCFYECVKLITSKNY